MNETFKSTQWNFFFQAWARIETFMSLRSEMTRQVNRPIEIFIAAGQELVTIHEFLGSQSQVWELNIV